VEAVDPKRNDVVVLRSLDQRSGRSAQVVDKGQFGRAAIAMRGAAQTPSAAA
jgi:hypothetical protein